MAMWNSYWLIPTLRAQADQVIDLVADLPTKSCQHEISTDRFLLWELRQVKCQIWHSGRSSARSGARSISPNGNYKFLLIDSYTESSGRSIGRSGGRSTPPHQMVIWIPTDRFLLWELRQIKWQIYPPPEYGNLKFLLIDSYSESSGRSSGRSNPQKMPTWNSYW